MLKFCTILRIIDRSKQYIKFQNIFSSIFNVAEIDVINQPISVKFGKSLKDKKETKRRRKKNTMKEKENTIGQIMISKELSSMRLMI